MTASSPLRAGILTIGSELVTGQRLDTNSRWLSRRLEGLGYAGWRHHSCPDDVETICCAIRHAVADVEVLLVTGGLGPTSDDLTREAVANLLEVSLELHQPSWDHIQELFARFQREASPSNRHQAMLPRGARVLHNDVGTAPGFACELSGVPIYLLPGVPREMRWMWKEHLERELGERVPPGAARHEWSFRTVGIAESALGELLHPLEEESGVEVRYAAEEALGTIQITLLVGRAGMLPDLQERARALCGTHLCAEGADTLAEALVAQLLRSGLSLATAESCTGGRVAAALTEVPGVSACFSQGVVAYSNEVKSCLLGVPARLFESEGAVSEAVARSMATGVRERAGADLGLGVTGIAGPEGGSAEKPVGLVHMAVASGPDQVLTLRRVYPGDRGLIQARATAGALDLIRRALP